MQSTLFSSLLETISLMYSRKASALLYLEALVLAVFYSILFHLYWYVLDKTRLLSLFDEHQCINYTT